ncbi:GNAT family N-acetyltransferase [Bacillus sonorensis]|uniref:GNAT family N-acetyltransferase n=1 Tax=Bacillus sonorensis TaxID=119858 RepID=UPI002DBDAA8A|nr:GNAT family N-acetyltransferase [Bacillus sonorensis]
MVKSNSVLSLSPMSKKDFTAYSTYSIEHYAIEKVKAGTWTAAEAVAKAEEQIQQLLPNGTETANHHLFSIVNEQGEVMGWAWFYADPHHPLKEAFIYDLGLYEAFRGQGNGQQALAALEEQAKRLGVKKLSLHVFAHNKTARHLYEKMNFEVTDLNMSKWL